LNSVQIARFIIGGAWIYHGVFPKLLHVAPLEEKLTSSIGLSAEYSLLLTRFAGIGEIIFGILFLLCYKVKRVNYINISALTALLLFSAIQLPIILIEAFNPVTTNIPLIGLSIIILNSLGSKNGA